MTVIGSEQDLPAASHETRCKYENWSFEMKTSLIASIAFAALLVPSIASAGSLSFDPAAGTNDPNFVAAPVNVNSANALAAKADAARYAEAAQATKSDAVVGTHGSATGASTSRTGG